MWANLSWHPCSEPGCASAPAYGAPGRCVSPSTGLANAVGFRAPTAFGFQVFYLQKTSFSEVPFPFNGGEGRREEGADGARCRTPRAAPRAERARGRGAGRRKPRAHGRARPSREPLGSTAPGVCVKPHLRACEWERRSSPSFEVSSRKQVTQV